MMTYHRDVCASKCIILKILKHANGVKTSWVVSTWN